MSDHLIRLLAEGKNYYWALRQSHEGGEDALRERMGYRYPAGAVRRLDDALLAIFGEQYVTLEGNSHRVPKLRARLEKLTGPDA